LIQGAHSILKRIDTQDGRRARWLRDLVARRGKQVAAVALANKNARVEFTEYRCCRDGLPRTPLGEDISFSKTRFLQPPSAINMPNIRNASDSIFSTRCSNFKRRYTMHSPASDHGDDNGVL
jgi:hypothetical protein